MPQTQPSILGISFDGLAISGIVNEFLNVATALRGDKFRVLFDPGFDITLGRTADSGHLFLPKWVDEIRCVSALPEDYTSYIINEAINLVVSGMSIAAAKVYDNLCSRLAESIVETFKRENVRFLVVENGTLPDNPLFTEAVYIAINEYGAQHSLGKFVLWRDHDLMWSAEPHFYGSFPYQGVRKPENNPYVHYAVATKWMQLRMKAWASSAVYHIIPNRFLASTLTPLTKRSLRSAYAIPEDAYLIARCTRVVPQKSIERDLRLLAELRRRLEETKEDKKVFLFVTGPIAEDEKEFKRLCVLEKELSIEGMVIWGDGLLSYNPLMINAFALTERFSIRELLAESDLSSFLTTYDYEGFGNPPGEAMAAGIPFISTTYELYHEVYGSKGSIAPLLSINRNSTPDEQIPEDFIVWTLRVLSDGEYRKQIIKHNHDVCRRFFSLDALERQLRELFTID